MKHHVRLLVNQSIIMPLKGQKLHFHAPMCYSLDIRNTNIKSMFLLVLSAHEYVVVVEGQGGLEGAAAPAEY